MVKQAQFETDVIRTSDGPLEITFLGHGTLMLAFGGLTIHVDPYSDVADYAQLPKADVVLVTHEHSDHLDLDALAKIRTPQTEIVLNEAGAEEVGGGLVMHNGDAQVVKGLQIEAAPAYNIIHKRSNGQPFHPKGAGNGYVITCGDTRVYIAGDTEAIPEMEHLADIAVAFLPMNLPYTMTPEMAAQAALAVGARIVYPYHYGSTDPSKLVSLLSARKDIEVRIRKMA